MNTVERESHVEAAAKSAESGDTGHDSIDRIDLFKSNSHSPKFEKPEIAKGQNESGVLDFSQNDPLEKFSRVQTPSSGEQKPGKSEDKPAPDSNSDIVNTLSADKNADGAHNVHDTTRRDKFNKAKVDKGDEVSKDNAQALAGNEKPEPFRVVGNTANLDPEKPTVVFLDSFESPHQGRLFTDEKSNKLTIATRTELPVNTVSGTTETGTPLQKETGFTHGEFSARLAEQNGFNAVRLHQNDPKEETTNYSNSLNRIADLVDNGKLNLGSGDVVNISLGNGDLTFDQVNDLLGSNKENKITPENVDEPAVQEDILKRLAAIGTDASENPTISNWAKNAVETNKAIERLQAQGIEVLHAAANDGPGSISLEFLKANYELASVDSTTGKPDKFATKHDLITPGNGVLPIRFKPGTEIGGEREGKYTVEGTGITFKGSEFGNLNTQQTVNLGGENLPREDAVLNEFYSEKIGREAPPKINENGFLVAVASGNSYVNVQFLAAQRERLAAMKKSAKIGAQ